MDLVGRSTPEQMTPAQQRATNLLDTFYPVILQQNHVDPDLTFVISLEPQPTLELTCVMPSLYMGLVFNEQVRPLLKEFGQTLLDDAIQQEQPPIVVMVPGAALVASIDWQNA